MRGIAWVLLLSAPAMATTKVGKHMILFEPGGGQMVVNETYLCDSTGGGTLQFYLPAAANGNVTVQATGAGGVAVEAAVKKTLKPDVYAVGFPVKPGETRFDLSYTVPYTEGAAYEGKIATKDENTYLIAPNGMTLQGENLNDLGLEPRTQAHIYGLTGAAYKVVLTGAAAAAPEETAEASDSESGPRIEAIMPRIYGQAWLILALALGALALGLALLYRASAAAKFGKPESKQPLRGASVDEVYISKEALPQGQVRCPRCSTVLDIEASKIPTAKSTDPTQAAIASLTAHSGMQQVKLRCPKCRAVMDMIGVAPQGDQ
jgi:phage FluMu protein Com